MTAHGMHPTPEQWLLCRHIHDVDVSVFQATPVPIPPPPTNPQRLAGLPELADLLSALVVHVGMAPLDELHRQLVQGLEVVAGVGDLRCTPGRFPPHPHSHQMETRTQTEGNAVRQASA